MRLRFILFAAASVLSLVSSGLPAMACQCGPMPSVPDERKRSDAVFEAELTKLPDGRFEAKVLRVYKGSPPSTLIIVQGDCPPYPSAGRWLVYAYAAGSNWGFNYCGRSRLLKDAAADIAELTKP